LLRCEAEPELRGHGPDHKGAGARWTQERLGLPALAVQGHHGGMRSPGELQSWLDSARVAGGIEQALLLARAALPELGEAGVPAFPTFAQTSKRAGELFLRLLFSCLVDADFLDTEQHFNAGRSKARGADVAMTELFERLQHDQAERFAAVPDSPVNRARREIFAHCLEAARQPTGLFRLAVPTGGGKTRSGMAFAV